MLPSLSTGLLIACGCCLTAAEPLSVRDLRLIGTAGMDSGTYTTVFDRDSGLNSTFETETTLVHRVGILGIGSFGPISGAGSALLGVSLTQHQFETESARALQGTSSVPASVGNGNATVFGLHVGWAIQVAGRLHLEATAHAGYGGFTGEETLTTVDLTTMEVSTGRWRSRNNGWYAEAGFTGTAAYTFYSGMQVLVQIAYIHAEGENTINERGNPGTADYDYLVGARVRSEYEMDEVLGSVGLGYRF